MSKNKSRETGKQNEKEKRNEKNERIVFLQGDQIYLRPLELEDENRCRRWMNDQVVRRFLTMRFPMGEMGERAWIEKASKGSRDEITLAIVLNENDQHLGNLGFHQIDWVNRNATFGIVIGETAHHRRGIATEAGRLMLSYAFNELNLHRVNSMLLSLNVASLAMHRKLGFREEGRRREKWFIHGQWADEVLFGMLRSEFKG